MHIVESVLYDYADGVLSQSDAEIADNHFANCPACMQKMQKIKSIEDDIRSYQIDADFLSEKMENIYADIKPKNIENKFRAFFSRKLSFGMAGAFAFSFAMVVVGAIKVFSPDNENITRIVQGASPNASLSNIHPVSARGDEGIADHIDAIKGLGYKVEEHDGTYIIFTK